MSRVYFLVLWLSLTYPHIRLSVDTDIDWGNVFSRTSENSSKSVVVDNVLPYFCSTCDFSSSISGMLISGIFLMSIIL